MGGVWTGSFSLWGWRQKDQHEIRHTRNIKLNILFLKMSTRKVSGMKGKERRIGSRDKESSLILSVFVYV